MPRPMGQMRIMISARVVFDLEEADKVFRDKGPQEYADYMRGRGAYEKDFDSWIGGRKLNKGPMWDFVATAMEINKRAADKGDVIEIAILCKDTLVTARTIFRNLDLNGFEGIEHRIATAGKDIRREDHEAFETDLLLTRNATDAQNAVDLDIAAAVINVPPGGTYAPRNDNRLRLWFDGDAVAFGSSAEKVYRDTSLEAYREHEAKNFDQPVEEGPFTKFLVKASKINEQFNFDDQPFELSLLTARGANAAAHVPTIAEHFGIVFNGCSYFMGGAAKVNPLKAFRPHLFLDDQMAHLKESMAYCPTGLVAYKTGSAMHQHQLDEAAKKAGGPAPDTGPAPAPKG